MAGGSPLRVEGSQAAAHHSDVNDAAPNADDDSLGSVAGAKLLHRVLDMDLHGVFTDRQDVSDLPIAIAGSDQLEDFARRSGLGLAAEKWLAPNL